SPAGSLLYPFGPEQQDRVTPKLDDGTSPRLPLATPFPFYGRQHRSLYVGRHLGLPLQVNNNGVVSFDSPVKQYQPQPLPLADGRPFVAPFWGDVDNVRGGEVFYRESSDPELLARVTADISSYFPDSHFVATWAFVATWDRVNYYGSTTNKANTFQAVLATDSKVSFVFFNYWEIQWTTGEASDGDDSGLGGTPAHAGFNSGDDTNFYNLPGSRTAAIINITGTSNIGLPGRWVFRVDEAQVTGVPTQLPEVAPNSCWL
ncbi:SNED1 protein, partial [Rhinopomastus cyanomelas]|nr:SNED1 protein [Rhinopomastus cyanomelas]